MTVQELMYALEMIPEDFEVLMYESSEKAEDATYLGTIVDNINLLVDDDGEFEPAIVLSSGEYSGDE